MVNELNIETACRVEDDAWPDHPKIFIPPLLRYYEGQHYIQQGTSLTKSIQKGSVSSETTDQPVPKYHLQEEFYETRQLDEILNPLDKSSEPQFILIEGPPGIGKSALLQEISYRWSKKLVLTNFKFVLLIHLRDPIVQQTSKTHSLHNFLQVLCKFKGDGRQPDIAFSSHFLAHKGKDIVFLFDGFDEFPSDLREDSLIVDILTRQVLPKCGLIVSSCPFASEILYEEATLTVNIVGFTEVERKQFVQQALSKQPHKVKELTQYLDDHLSISCLCSVPFNMAVLVYLCKQGVPFPSNATQLYERFLCLTITHHLSNLGNSHVSDTISDLADLPESCKMIVMQLSKLALVALSNKKLIFTLDEIKSSCPDITVAINGFGLLQTVQYLGLAEETVTFNFIHFSIQEFLAAYYVTHLPPDEELTVLQDKFENHLYNNMFSFYITLTKGQRQSFKQFLSKGDYTFAISDKFLKNMFICLWLFRCFYEVGDEAICNLIQNAKIFQDKLLDFVSPYLTMYDVECITFFLMHSSHKKWEMLSLYESHIQDHGLWMLHRGLVTNKITIRGLRFYFNGLTQLSSSSISDLVIHCEVEWLVINGNFTIGEDYNLYKMLSHPSSRLVRLYMSDIKLSSEAAIALFTVIEKQNILQVLSISHNDITDDTCVVIASALRKNKSLIRLAIHGNTISVEASKQIIQALNVNNMLEEFYIPQYYSKDVKKEIKSLQEDVNESRQSRGCPIKLNISFYQ